VADTAAASKPEIDSKLETTEGVNEQLAAQLVEQARSEGLSLVGEGGLLQN
jgi:hypothetical protein